MRGLTVATATPLDPPKGTRSSIDPLDLYDIRSELTEDEAMVQDTVRRFVDAEVLPIIREHFEQHTFPRDIIPQIAELGLLGSTIDGYGCAGMNQVSYGLVCQELERGDSGIRSFVSVQSSLVMHPIYAYGSEAQKQEWLPRLATAEAVGCFGLTEPHGGSDPGNMKTVAKRDGDDWRISGSKMWITNAPIADMAVIWAMTDDGVRGFIVPTDTPGFDIQEIENKFSLRASLTGALFLDDVRVPGSAMLPNVKGLRGPLGCLTKARYGITWGCIGAAQACLDAVIDYTADRELFGRPLNHNQAIQLRMAEMARQITMAQLLSYRLGRLNDAGNMRPEQVSVAKWHNARMAIDTARDARDILGGSGISAEYVPIRHALNLESVITYEGTETVHQLVVGKALTGVNAF
ncbi:MAG: acyl-CoA dehydrogenase family protein [Pseudomonadota bacterium]